MKKPKEKGWLQDYLEFRKDLFKEITLQRKASHPEHSLYRILQPLGLMYGQTVGELDVPSADSWDEKDKMKILLAESLISSALLFQNKPINTAEDMSEAFVKSLESIGNFYNRIFPELSTPVKTLFGKKRSPLEVAERILDKRIERTANFKENFWTSFFHNSLLFLDVFIFGQWIHTNADRIVTDFFRYEREELRFSVLKVIAAASHSDEVVHYEEQKLVEYFILGTDLPSARKKEALTIFNKGVSMDEINLPSENSWILKKFYLEIAILTAWADRKVEKDEQAFLRDFCHHLGFTEDDLENSMIAVEGFVLEHWHQLEYLQDKQDFQRVSEHYISRMAKVAERNKGRLLKEIQDREVLMQLLVKARSQELTPEEAEQVRIALIQLMKTIPTFVIISLPQRFLTLPILMKILPKGIFTAP
ncbi:MAG: TerB family tellurite resistance protein [Cyclobacteriaceae bacterium]|jgi:tellurite resistance protein|nr:TerB family tellurite resistance protein [Cyclobacteriaceae bacterium]